MLSLIIHAAHQWPPEAQWNFSHNSTASISSIAEELTATSHFVAVYNLCILLLMTNIYTYHLTSMSDLKQQGHLLRTHWLRVHWHGS